MPASPKIPVVPTLLPRLNQPVPWRVEQLDRDRMLRSVLWLLIVVSLASMTGRILQVRSSLGETPLLSANDRSRWATIRALVDHGTYAIDDVIFLNSDGSKRDREWYTIDMVRHRGRDGRLHYYSSKPPLLATLLAGPYWLLQKTTGATLADQPFYVIRCLLVLVNVLPLGLLFWLLGRLAMEYGRTSWGRLFLFAGITWGTFLVTFATTLNNHIPAAVSVGIALWAGVRIHEHLRPAWWWFSLAGFFGAFAVTNELPALSFFALLAVWCFLRSGRRLVTAFLPAAFVVAVAFFATNFAAHHSWRPPYAHRQDGAVLATVDRAVADQLDRNQLPPQVAEALQAADPSAGAELELIEFEPGQRWVVRNPETGERWALVAQSEQLEIRQWDNWYDYERSYWNVENKRGVDRGEASRWRYAFHMLLGHHGVFSLTPLWCMTAIGIVLLLRRADRYPQSLCLIALGTTVLSLVCIAFYIARPLADRNYGGVTSGFRWLFWLAPLWLLAAIPAADRAARHSWLRVLALILLGLSVVSACYATLNPWVHPWIYQYWIELNWIVENR